MVVRSDNGGEFNLREFGQLCRKRNIRQDLTTADSPEYNGVAERGLALIESAAIAARTQASELFTGFDIPETHVGRGDELGLRCVQPDCDCLQTSQ